jgi:hypothetical protein
MTYVMIGNCVRCHAKGHARASCKEPAGKWEAKLDQEKDKYWAGTLKWHQKALAENTPYNSPAKTKSTPPPTLVQNDSRRRTLAPLSSDSDDEALTLQSRSHQLPDQPDPDDADSDEDHPPPFRTADAVAHYHFLEVVQVADSDESFDSDELTPAELVEAIIESTCLNTIDKWGDSAL